jgi:hypothetical protein
MTLNRMTILISAIFLALAAAIGVAAAAGGQSGSPSHDKLMPIGTMTLLPWDAHELAMYKVTYHPHQMCDDVRHPAHAKSAM